MSTDVLISFDTTGSMSPCIQEVRRRLDYALGQLFSTIPDLRISIISHGDYCDAPREMEIIDFTDDVNALKRFVHDARNTNGGDSDEFYELVMNKARFLNWKADTKLFMLIGDAEPHDAGYTFHGKRYTLQWTDEAHALKDLGVKIYSVQALGNRRAEMFYQTLSSITGGKRVELNQFADSVETIIAVSLHSTGNLEPFKKELIDGFRMNRNLANLFKTLEGEAFTYEVASDTSGLIPVPPARFQILHVDATTDIKSFVQAQGISFKKGRGFYQFMKSEIVQEHKEVVLRNKVTGDLFTGAEARNFIGLPFGERGRIRPKYFDDYEVYIQSTSANRKLIAGYKFLYENTYY